MKKILISLVFIAFATVIFIGCDFFLNEETYVYDAKDEESGTCVSLTTKDAAFKAAAKVAGWELGSCSDEDSLGECKDCNEVPEDQAEMFGDGDSDKVKEVAKIMNQLIGDGTKFGVSYYPKSLESFPETQVGDDEGQDAINAAKEAANEKLTELCAKVGGTWAPAE